jgi:hypothetical protein
VGQDSSLLPPWIAKLLLLVHWVIVQFCFFSPVCHLHFLWPHWPVERASFGPVLLNT